MIINAVQYSSNGIISIFLRKYDDSFLEFIIEDQGIGIPKNELKDIFGVFTVSSKTKTPSGGRGVGLALANKIVEKHKGSIMASSDGIKGAKLRVLLPIRYISK